MMMGSSMGIGGFLSMLLMNLLIGGGPNDLLDYLPSDAYWKQKAVSVSVETMIAELKPAAPAGDITKLIEELGSTDFNVREATSKKIAAMGSSVVPQLEKAAQSPDAEVAQRAKDLIAQLKTGAKAAAVRRLMAIRTLGELKDKSAVPALTPLLQSKEMFESDYAAAALAAIDGKPYTRPQIDAKTRAADLNVLPDKLGLVGQVMPIQRAGQPVSLVELVKAIVPPGGGRGEVMDKMVKGIITLAEMVGNIRLDSVTVGLSQDLGNRTGFFAVIVRGQYDHQAVGQAILQTMTDQIAGRPADVQTQGPALEEIDGVSLLKLPHDGPILLMPDDQRLVFAGAPQQDDREMARQQLIPGIKAGKGKIGQDADMTHLLKDVDTTKPLWLVTRVNDNYRRVPLLAAFDTLVVTAEPRGADIDVKLTANGTDAAKVKAAVDEANGYVSAGVKGLEHGLTRLPPGMPPATVKGGENALVTLKGIKIDADGAKAIGNATIKDAGQIIMMLPAYWFYTAMLMNGPPPAAMPMAPPAP